MSAPYCPPEMARHFEALVEAICCNTSSALYSQIQFRRADWADYYPWAICAINLRDCPPAISRKVEELAALIAEYGEVTAGQNVQNHPP